MNVVGALARSLSCRACAAPERQGMQWVLALLLALGLGASGLASNNGRHAFDRLGFKQVNDSWKDRIIFDYVAGPSGNARLNCRQDCTGKGRGKLQICRTNAKFA